MKPALIVFGGLPGTGKTTLAKKLAARLQATYLRIDTIEQTLLRLDSLKTGTEGYLTAYAICEDNLRAGNTVITDSVNPIPDTRNAWRDIAKRNHAECLEIEIICSNPKEHKNRVETREADIKGHKAPTWNDVQKIEYHPWETKTFSIDTYEKLIDSALTEILEKIKP